MIFDSHAHYDDEAFDGDREELLSRFYENGISNVVNVSSDLRSVERTVMLTEKYPFIYGAVGIHPSDTGELKEEDIGWLEKQCARAKIVAVGEIGLDYHWQEPDRGTQKEWFDRQLAMAKKVKLPVIIHSREAAKDTLDMMKAAKADGIGGVVHCFSYTKEMAVEYLSMGFFFGIGGVITFQNAKKLKEAVEYIPLDRILLETDSPYLSPVPYRGKRNSSLNLPLVAQEIARIKDVEYDEVVERTSQNAERLFRVQENSPGAGGFPE